MNRTKQEYRPGYHLSDGVLKLYPISRKKRDCRTFSFQIEENNLKLNIFYNGQFFHDFNGVWTNQDVADWFSNLGPEYGIDEAWVETVNTDIVRVRICPAVPHETWTMTLDGVEVEYTSSTTITAGDYGVMLPNPSLMIGVSVTYNDVSYYDAFPMSYGGANYITTGFPKHDAFVSFFNNSPVGGVAGPARIPLDCFVERPVMIQGEILLGDDSNVFDSTQGQNYGLVIEFPHRYPST
ncbi:MAG: hypothetical protein AAFN81_27965 [Bacteroidota bacterium]